MGPRLARRAGAAWLLALSFAFTSAAAAELGATLDGLLAHARERLARLTLDPAVLDRITCRQANARRA